MSRKTAQKSERGNVTEWPVKKLVPFAGNPRLEEDEENLATLVESIRTHGVLNPLIARRVEGEALEVVAGNRRLKAAALAGLDNVTVIIRDLSDNEARIVAIVENIEREDLNPLDEARAYSALAAEGMTAEEIAKRVTKPESRITSLLSLLEMPEAVQEFVTRRELTPSHAAQLRRVSDQGEDIMLELASMAAEHRFSVSDLEEKVQEYLEYVDQEKIAALRRAAQEEERKAKIEARRQALEELRKNGELGPVHDQLVKEMAWDSFQNLSYHGTLPMECSHPSTCPYGARGTLVTYSGEQVPACFNPKHWRELQEKVRKEERTAEKETEKARTLESLGSMPRDLTKERLVFVVGALLSRHSDSQIKAWGRGRGLPWNKLKAATIRAEHLLPFLEASSYGELVQLLLYEANLAGRIYRDQYSHVRLYAEERRLFKTDAAEVKTPTEARAVVDEAETREEHTESG